TAQYQAQDLEGALVTLGAARAALEGFDLETEKEVDLVEAAVDVFLYLGMAQHKLGRAEDALSSARRQVALCERLRRDFPQVPSYRGMLGAAEGSLATYLQATGAAAEARAASRRAVALLEELLRERPNDPMAKRSLIAHGQTLARGLFLDGQRTSLEEALARSRQIAELAQSDPQSRTFHVQAHGALQLLAEIERASAAMDGARDTALAALELATSWTEKEPASFEAAAAVAVSAELGTRIAFESGANEEASELLARGEDALERTRALRSKDRMLREVELALAKIAALLAVERGELAVAEAAATALAERELEDGWRAAEASAAVRSAIWRRSRSTEHARAAELALAEFLQTMRARSPADRSRVPDRRAEAEAEIALAALLAARGENEDALGILDQALPILRELRPLAHHAPSAEVRLGEGAALRAELLLARNEPEAALDELERLAEELPAALRAALASSGLRALEGQPRFEALRAR
ncbi:MAG: hypothetical protein JNM84_22750, partial [Planctomycetes bacterium]|nr:hypothetical protein [Planctomycetota bacterium]